MLLAIMAVVAGVVVWNEFRTPAPVNIDTELETGTHLTLAFVAPTSPGTDVLVESVQAAKVAMRERASLRGYYYSTVGVSDDWSVERGLQILNDFGPFDEVVVGRNWFNLGVTEFISMMGGRPAVPQIVVTLRYVRTDTIPFVYGEPVELARLVGHSEVEDWVGGGFRTTEDGFDQDN